MRFWRQYVENSAIKLCSRGRPGDVTRWTSNSSARRALRFSVIAKDITQPECRLISRVTRVCQHQLSFLSNFLERAGSKLPGNLKQKLRELSVRPSVRNFCRPCDFNLRPLCRKMLPSLFLRSTWKISTEFEVSTTFPPWTLTERTYRHTDRRTAAIQQSSSREVRIIMTSVMVKRWAVWQNVDVAMIYRLSRRRLNGLSAPTPTAASMAAGCVRSSWAGSVSESPSSSINVQICRRSSSSAGRGGTRQRYCNERQLSVMRR